VVRNLKFPVITKASAASLDLAKGKSVTTRVTWIQPVQKCDSRSTQKNETFIGEEGFHAIQNDLLIAHLAHRPVAYFRAFAGHHRWHPH
jgi:hypothetical protein